MIHTSIEKHRYRQTNTPLNRQTEKHRLKTLYIEQNTLILGNMNIEEHTDTHKHIYMFINLNIYIEL